MKKAQTGRIASRVPNDIIVAMDKHIDKMLNKNPDLTRHGAKSEVIRKALELFLHVRK